MTRANIPISNHDQLYRHVLHNLAFKEIAFKQQETMRT